MASRPDSHAKLRSRARFDPPDNIDRTALNLERDLDFGPSLEALQSGEPIIGIAQTKGLPRDNHSR